MKEKYQVHVNFVMSYCYEIEDESKEDAMEKARDLAVEDFHQDLVGGYVSSSDFYCDVLEP